MPLFKMLPDKDCRIPYDVTYETFQSKKEDQVVYLLALSVCAPSKSKMIYATVPRMPLRRS